MNTIKKGTLATFNKEYKRYNAIYPNFADTVQSTTAVEDHTGIGATPPMTEFKDELVPGKIYDYGYNLANKEWTAALAIKKSTIEDQQLGQLNRRVAQMARKAARFIDLHMAQTLERNGQGPEGQMFFIASHRSGANQDNQRNNFTGAPLNKNNLVQARAAMRSFKDDQSEVVNVIPTKLIVPPALENQAYTQLKAVTIDGTDNVLANSMTPIVNPYLTSETAWYVIGDENPLIWQERVAVEFISVPPDTSGNTAQIWLFYTRLRGVGGYGDWRYAVKSDA